MNGSFYQERTVLVTGHTGFKGAWLCKLLSMLGAHVVGYALAPPTDPSAFQLARIGDIVTDIRGDMRDYTFLLETVKTYQPQIVLHMAAQPIVLEGYNNPMYTYETNVMGTVHLLEALRQTGCARSVVNVTTDKVYQNNEWYWGYRENDLLDGHDPYANSKTCSEMVTATYRRSFPQMPPISTCRAGNVIGGGDFAKNRILPDCVRAAQNAQTIAVRNPLSVRPYQHVLEPLWAYLMVARKQYENPTDYAGAYNVGPNNENCLSTKKLVDLFCQEWGDGLAWEEVSTGEAVHESNLLMLDSTKIKRKLGWIPRWSAQEAVGKTVDWAKAYCCGKDVVSLMESQIEEYLSEVVYEI